MHREVARTQLAFLFQSAHFPQSAEVLHPLSFFSLVLHPFAQFFDKLAELFASQICE